MPPPVFPLRWESTGDQWWYASPIDWAAANGLYDVVLELLHMDTNLLIKLTSLRRIRRLEILWDDQDNFHDVAACRSVVAWRLLLDCDDRRGSQNSLIRAGYGGWLLYTAAAAGDERFVGEILRRDPNLVFGEGEYGVTDILYAAARGKNSEVFTVLLDLALGKAVGEKIKDESDENQCVLKEEMMNRAVHAAARGGNLGVLKELIKDCNDLLIYRDSQGCTVLHSASGRGQLEVVKELLLAHEELHGCRDNQGNTALHIAAYKGHLSVVKLLIVSCPSLISAKNNDGDAFLHMAISGFQAPGFRRVDCQVELLRYLISGEIATVNEVVNATNNHGRSALHIAVAEKISSEVVEVLISSPLIDLNIRDNDGLTPLDLLRQSPGSASSETLAKRLVSAGGITGVQNVSSENIVVKDFGISVSPGTSFRVSDSEIFLYTGLAENHSESGYDLESVASESSGYLAGTSGCLSHDEKGQPPNPAARRLKSLLLWRKRSKKTKSNSKEFTEMEFSDELAVPKFWDYRRIPLRQLFSRSRDANSFSDLPSQSARMRFAEGLMQGVIKAGPELVCPVTTPSSNVLEPSDSSSKSVEKESSAAATPPPNSSIEEQSGDYTPPLEAMGNRRSANRRFLNMYLCFGAQGLATDDSRSWAGKETGSFSRATSLVA